MAADYWGEHWQNVKVKGIACQFSDMRIRRETIPAEKFVYEVAGDDEDGGTPTRIKRCVLVNFYGTLICNQKFPLGEDGILWLEDGDWLWED